MQRFAHAHATHPDWRMACSLVLAQLHAQMRHPGVARDASLALLYLTDHYADAAESILALLSAELPTVTDWSGTVGVGIAASDVEYWDEPALAVMLCDLPPDQYRVFSGVAPLGMGDGMGFEAHAALVHADASMPDLAELLGELAARTQTGYLFGGLASSRGRVVQFAVPGNGNVAGQGAASGVFAGGMSGVAFGAGVTLLSRVTQGCQPVAGVHTVTAVDRNLLITLDGEPALAVLLRDLQVSQQQPETALAAIRATLAGLCEAQDDPVRHTGQLGSDVRVRHIIGLDPARQGVAIAELPAAGQRLAFCQRNPAAARADLIRVCTEIREALEPQDVLDAATGGAVQAARGMAGAVYISCSGRGGAHFGGPSAEMHIVRRALGDVPLVGFFAGGEIARHHLYGYTGVLTVFV